MNAVYVGLRIFKENTAAPCSLNFKRRCFACLYSWSRRFLFFFFRCASSNKCDCCTCSKCCAAFQKFTAFNCFVFSIVHLEGTFCYRLFYANPFAEPAWVILP